MAIIFHWYRARAIKISNHTKGGALCTMTVQQSYRICVRYLILHETLTKAFEVEEKYAMWCGPGSSQDYAFVDFFRWTEETDILTHQYLFCLRKPIMHAQTMQSPSRTLNTVTKRHKVSRESFYNYIMQHQDRTLIGF